MNADYWLGKIDLINQRLTGLENKLDDLETQCELVKSEILSLVKEKEFYVLELEKNKSVK